MLIHGLFFLLRLRSGQNGIGFGRFRLLFLGFGFLRFFGLRRLRRRGLCGGRLGSGRGFVHLGQGQFLVFQFEKILLAPVLRGHWLRTRRRIGRGRRGIAIRLEGCILRRFLRLGRGCIDEGRLRRSGRRLHDCDLNLFQRLGWRLHLQKIDPRHGENDHEMDEQRKKHRPPSAAVRLSFFHYLRSAHAAALRCVIRA